MKRHLAFAWILLGSLLALIPVTVFLKASASNSKSRPAALGVARLNDRATVRAAGRGAPRLNLADGHEVLTAYAGDPHAQWLLQQNLVQPLAMASSDFDEDGVPDLVSGYAAPNGGMLTLHRGNVDAIYPNTLEARQRKAGGTFTDAPFLSPARGFETPRPVDFIGCGDFDADGHWDVVTAARGGNILYFLLGDGRGNLSAARQVDLPGLVTALVAGEINRADGLTDLVVGIAGAGGPQVLVFEGPEGALRAKPEAFSLAGVATAMALGRMDDDYTMDLVVAAGSDLMVVYGRDRRLSLDEIAQRAVLQARISQRSLGFAVRSVAIGNFKGDQTTGLSLLTDQGNLHLLSRTAVKAKRKKETNGIERWKDEILSTEYRPLATAMVSARVSSVASDSLVIVDSGSEKLHIVTTSPAIRQQKAMGAQSVSFDVQGAPMAVLPMRLNSDALSDLVILRKGGVAPSVAITASAMTFTVTSSADAGAGTLREAIDLANANAGADTINFSIGSGQRTIDLLSPLSQITEAVTIDGTTQPEFAGFPLIELNGAGVVNAGLNPDGLTIIAAGCTIRALVVNRFPDSFAGIVIQGASTTGTLIEGNFIGTDAAGTAALANAGDGVLIGAPNTVVGGTTAAARNLISGNGNDAIDHQGANSSGSLIQGNLIGTDITGTIAVPNNNSAVFFFNSSNNIIGGTGPGAGNVISGTTGGAGVEFAGSTGSMVQGNFIGTNAAGTAGLANQAVGVLIQNLAANTLVGGTTVQARNVISGNITAGVNVQTGGTGNLIQGNFIGTNAAGTPLSNGPFALFGINVGNGAGNAVGGTAAGAGNVIAFNAGTGVNLVGGVNTAIFSNSIFSNAQLGISLFGSVTPTPNDVCDGDSGPNNLQNFPVLASAFLTSEGSTTSFVGILNSTPNTTYRIEFFSSTACDPSGNGEGQTFIGFTNVTTPPAVCDAAINVTFPVGCAVGEVITATATDPSNNTSEFSQCVTVVGMGPVSDLQITKSDAPDPVVTGSNITYTIAVSNNGPNTDAGVTFTDVIPAGTTFVSLTSPGSCSTPPVGGTGAVICSLGAIAPAGSVAISLVVNVNAAPGATITNTAMVSGMSADMNLGNNSAAANTAVIAGPCMITCPPAQIKSNDLNQCGAAVTYPAPTTSGSCGTVTCTPATGSFFPKGTTVVTCNASAGPSCAFNVTVNDTQAPTIACPSNQTAAATGPTAVNYPPPTAADNCPGVSTACNPPSGSTFPLGTTTVTCIATDMSANTASCNFTVTVATCTLTCPPNLLAFTSPAATSCGAVVPYSPTTSGGCGTVNCAPPSGSFFNVGTANVTCTAGDGPSCSFTVTVEDNTPPRVLCPPSNSLATPPGQSSAVVNYGAAGVSDNCPGASVECSPPSGSRFPVGLTIVSCTGTDSSSNSSTCTFSIIVFDPEAPVISCPVDVSAVPLPGQSSAVVNYPPPAVADNLPGASAICSPASGSSFPLGVTTVTCTATDAGGNKSSCSFRVGVGGPQTKVTIPGNKAAIEFGTVSPSRKPPKPKKNPCSLFTIENIGFAPLVLTLDSISRTGADVDNKRITDPNDTRFFTVSLLNADQSLTPIDIGGVLTIQPGKVTTLCVKFAALIPAPAGKTTELSASDVLPDTVNSKITFRQNAGANVSVPLLVRVSTGVVLINPVNPRTPPTVTFTRSGNDITVSYAVFDSNLDVSRAKYEFLDANGQVLAGPFEVDLTEPLRSLNLVKGQSFTVEQRFTGASDSPLITGVRVTVFDGETSVIGGSSTDSTKPISTSSIQVIKRAPGVTLLLPDVKLRPQLP